MGTFVRYRRKCRSSFGAGDRKYSGTFSSDMRKRYIDQNVLAKLTDIVKDEEVAQRVWTSQVLHFGVETTNRAESEHSVLKLWLSTCHGNLDTIFFNIDSLIQAQVAVGVGAKDVAVVVPFLFKNAFPEFTYQFIQNWKNIVGDGNCGFRVVSNLLFGDKNHWVERVTELIMQTNWEEGSAPREYWKNTPDHLYVIANTFNLCVLQLVDGCPLPPLHVQWEYHRDMRVSGWAAPYRN
ncbi:hypothetical protein M9H77_34066 [Catharanthus roseus]|uniref:Uncharacterized protein n=1 Tax=Catharanthus roseus TaxID=4058 RepID=A0ACB9ZLB0_CATRO|nr:hypothetical protein M9H77_34066 [Catharanthus roseus]